MPKPYINLRTVTPVTGGATLDLTALTGGVTGPGQLNGFTGADWVWLESNVYGLNALAYLNKQEGGSQLVPDVIGNPNLFATGNGFTDATVAFNNSDFLSQGANAYPGTASNAQCNVGEGLSFNKILADRRLAQVFFQHYIYGGTFTVTASLSDSSAPSQSITLSGDGLKGFAVDYVCNTQDGVRLKVDIVCATMATPGSNQSASLRPQLQWKPVPKLIFRPKVWEKYLMYRDFVGGANA